MLPLLSHGLFFEKLRHHAGVHAAYQNELSQLYETTTAQGKEIAALDQEIKNLKWLAGVVAGIVAGVIQFLSFLWKRG